MGRAARLILSEALAADADETRRFRHVAIRNYDSFEPHRAAPAIAAARRLAEKLAAEIEAFRAVIDPAARSAGTGDGRPKRS